MKAIDLCVIVAPLWHSAHAAQFSLPLFKQPKRAGPSSEFYFPANGGQKMLRPLEASSGIGSNGWDTKGFPVIGKHGDPYMYTTNISFGSPPQNFRAIIDINWAEPFVPSATCKDKICKKFLWYNSNASSTYIGNGTIAEIEYLPVKAEGYISSDILRIGEHLTLPSTTFVELKQYDDLFADNELSTFDTVLGFAIEKEWPAVNYGKSDRIPSQFRQMVNKDVLDRNIFSILFPRSQSEIGSIMFGGYDKDQAKGELVRHPLFPNNTTQWSIGLNELRFKAYGASDATYLGNQEAKSQWIARLASRSPYIGLPRDIVDSLFHHINWKRSACSYRLIVDCNRLDILPELTFVIDGQYISLKGTEYVERIKPAYDWSSPWLCKGPPEEQEEECNVMIGPMPDSWGPVEVQLGTSFLKKVYSVFDWDEKTISFGKLQN